MMRKSLPGLPHIVQSLQPTVEETERKLHESDARRPNWSYGLAWRLVHPLYSGEIGRKPALDACKRIKDPIGARCNAEVAEIIWEDAQGAEYICRPLSCRLFSIRKDLAIPVKPRLYFVKDGVAHIFWLQPWKKLELSTEQMGVLASVIKLTFAVDDFENAELYFLDTSEDDLDGVRRPQVFGFGDLPLLSMVQLGTALERFAVAYDAFQAKRKPRPKPRTPKSDDQQDDLFPD